MNMKRTTLLAIASIAVIGSIALAGQAPGSRILKKSAAPALQEGDILFQTMGGGQSDAIALATRSKWTHVGIAFLDKDEWMVYEAVGPVKATPLNKWIAQGNGHYAVKRLERSTPLDAATVAKLKGAIARFMGLAYDWHFLWSDDSIYCSELVWKLYAEGIGVHLCEPVPLKDYDLDSDLVRSTMEQRYGSAPPMDEPMVAPSTLFECPMLVTVLER